MGTATSTAAARVEPFEPRLLLSTYYVNASTGADANPGTSDLAAFKSLQKAANVVRAGDTVYVRAGTYTAGMNLFGNAGGRADAPISFLADPGATITRSATSGTNATMAAVNVENTGGWFVIEGFNITDPGQTTQRAGVRIALSPNCVVRNNTIDGCYDGVFASRSDNVVVEGNVCRNSYGEHGIYVNGSADYVIRGNECYGNPWNGIHTNVSDGVNQINSGGLIEGNVVHDNDLAGSDFTGMSKAVVRNNLIYGNGRHAVVLQNSNQGATVACHDDTFVNNTFDARQGSSAFAIQISAVDPQPAGSIWTGNDNGITLFNNVLIGSQTGSCGAIGTAGTPPASFQSDYNVTDGRFSTNLASGPVKTLAQWRPATGQDAHSAVAFATALFVNTTAGDYHLNLAAPAVDAGTPAFNDAAAPDTDLEGNPRPQGFEFDAGAFELPSVSPFPDTTPPTITSVSLSNLAGSSAVVSWNTNELSDTQVEYGTTADYGSATALNASPVTRHSAALTGLTDSTVYHYRVVSRDAAGNVATSGDFVLTTPAPDRTPPEVSGVTLSGLTATGAVVRWTTNEPADSQVEYGVSTDYGQSTPVNPSPVTSHSTALSGLSPATQYHYRILSRDTSGNLTTTADFTFTTATPDTTPPLIASVATSQVTASGATVTWTTDETSDTQVEYGASPSYGSLSTLSTSPVTTHSRTLTGLLPATTYHYRVRSKDAAGNLAVSGDFTFATLSLVFSPAPYYGDFTNYSPLTASRWQVAADGADTRLFLNTTNYSELDTYRLGEMAVARSRTLGDFDISLDARTGDDLAVNKFADYDVVFGYVDARNYSYLMMNATTSATTFTVITAGVGRSIGAAALAGVPDGNYHAVTLSRRGQMVSAMLDGRTLLSASDAALGRVGAVGVGSFNDSAYFDNFTAGAPTDTPPTAALTGADDKLADGSAYQYLTVTYTDDVGIDPSTIDSADLLITGPDGSSQPAALANPPTSSDPRTWTATYRIDAPGGAWDSADVGTYSVELLPQQVSDNSGHFAAATVLGSFTVRNTSQVVGRQTGYWDGQLNFIVEDKQALLPGAGAATFANYTNDAAGITALAVDFSALSRLELPTQASFAFRIGDGTNWSPVPAPTDMFVTRGGGANGSDRVLIMWPADTIKNRWLEVTVRADLATQLARDDVFYFGNLAGDTGDMAGGAVAAVNIRDVLALRRLAALDPTAGGAQFDFNHDGLVDEADLLVVRLNSAAALPLFQPAAVTSTTAASSASSGTTFGAASADGTRRLARRVRRPSYELLSSAAQSVTQPAPRGRPRFSPVH